MADVKIDSRPFGRDKKNSGEVRIMIKLTHRGQRKHIYTGVKVPANQFDGTMVVNNTRAPHLNKQIIDKLSNCLANLVELSGITDKMDIDTLARHVAKPRMETGSSNTGRNIFDALREYAEKLRKSGGSGTAHTYETTMAVLKDWWKGETLDFAMLTYAQLMAFREYMELDKKYASNTMSIHERNLRAIFNREIRFHRIPASVYPFKEFEVTRTKASHHRNLSAKKIRAIRDLEYAGMRPAVREARDMFMLSFYMAGINLVDLWNLNHKDAPDGAVHYFRQKTEHEYKFTIPAQGLHIINRYKGERALLLFRERIQHYDSWKKGVNKCLKEIGNHKDVGVSNLTYYHARHSWASLAYGEAGVSKGEISIALGHGAVSVTDGYIDTEYNRKIIDEANRKVIALL